MPEQSEGPLQASERPILTTIRTCQRCGGQGGATVPVGDPCQPEPEWQECDGCDGVTGFELLIDDPEGGWIGLLDGVELLRAQRNTFYGKLDDLAVLVLQGKPITQDLLTEMRIQGWGEAIAEVSRGK